jgi:glycosyltransferase involved in cell wall biosynthesis
MKIVIATPLYPPEIGGPATDAGSLVAYMRKQGIETDVCRFGDVRHLPKLLRHIAYGFQLAGKVKSAQCIVAFDTVSVGLPSVIISLLTRTPLVVRVPGDYAWEQGTQRFDVTDSIETFQHTQYGFRVELLRSIQKFVVRNAALSIAPSDYFKNIMSGWGIKPERLIRIYLGLNFDAPAHISNNVQDGKILFSLGRLVPWKGFHILIELMSELPGWKLLIAGDGPLQETLHEHAKTLGVLSRITFTGTLSKPQILDWFRRANAFVLNTSFESFSFQIIEAMASGTPVITTNIGSIPELIENGVEGILCSPNDKKAFRDAILSIETEPALWKKRTSAAVKKAQKFTIDNSMQLFLNALKTICD